MMITMNHLKMMLVPLAAACLGACGGAATTDRGGSAMADFDRAAEAPLPPGAVRVQLERYEMVEAYREVIEAAVDYRSEAGDAGVGPIARKNGLVVFAAESGVRAAVRAEQSRRTSRSVSRQFVVLQSGSRASLATWRTQPAPWPALIIVYGPRGLQQRFIDQRITGSGFVVKARQVSPDAVQLELTPYIHRARDGRAIAIDEVATTLTVRPGVPYVIAHDRGLRRSVGRALLSRRVDERTRDMLLIIQADVGTANP